MADKHARGVSSCLRSDFKLDSEWTGRPHERRATDPQAARDDALPSLRIPTRTGLTTADPIADALTSNARDPGVDSFEKCSPTATAAGPASECTDSDSCSSPFQLGACFVRPSRSLHLFEIASCVGLTALALA